MSASSLLRCLLDDCWSGSRALTCLTSTVDFSWPALNSVNTYHQALLPTVQTRASTVIFRWFATTCITIHHHHPPPTTIIKVQGEKKSPQIFDIKISIPIPIIIRYSSWASRIIFYVQYSAQCWRSTVLHRQTHAHTEMKQRQFHQPAYRSSLVKTKFASIMQ